MNPTVRFIQTNDFDTNQLQSNIIPPLNKLLNLPLNSSVLLTEVSLAVGDNTINHLLARKLRGWYIVRKRANSDIYDKQDTNPLQTDTLILNSSAAVTVDLIVF